MPITLTSTDRVSQNGVKCLVYGPAGVGKTVLCGSAPEPVIISAEKGLLSLRSKSIAVIEVTNVNELGEAYNWCVSSNEAKRFWTVCLDSISEIAEVILANLIKTVGAKDPRKAYGELMPQVSSVVRMFRDLPGKHVCITAKQEPIKDEMSGIVMYGPSMPGQKLGPQLPYFFDEVFALRIGRNPEGQTYRYIQTQPDLQFGAKDRSGVLSTMEQPDLTYLFKKMLGQ